MAHSSGRTDLSDSVSLNFHEISSELRNVQGIRDFILFNFFLLAERKTMVEG